MTHKHHIIPFYGLEMSFGLSSKLLRLGIHSSTHLLKWYKTATNLRIFTLRERRELEKIIKQVQGE